jgi:hypothetical protein
VALIDPGDDGETDRRDEGGAMPGNSSERGPHVVRTWRVERAEPVRADAPGLFVGHDELADAKVGDEVIVTCAGEEWRGFVADIIERGDGRYVRLDTVG